MVSYYNINSSYCYVLGTVCNIVILENYLNVKKIENEKKASNK